MKTKTEDHHHILVLGATGTFGLILIQFIHNLGHTLTLYMCGQSKLPESIVSSECVEVIQGELSDVDGLEIAASCGADVFICVAVPTWGRREVLSDSENGERKKKKNPERKMGEKISPL
ncbi:hypothetical protein GcM3_095032 [Golovinomyces cichoracearum]|uniref:Uncharacterized protein n=1 Tax=Golovinomyces cichoracearum TaxID=62708 RepID=A0A420IET3_9PEZI|nr:hypothetical protein GcM3_095032 [Golovinomyces cichoracearum]